MDQDLPLAISDFMGVSRKVVSEDLPSPYFDTIQNLWEKKLGELQVKGGSVNLVNTFPSAVTGLDNIFTLRLRNEIKRQVAAVYCTPITTTVAFAELNKCTSSFVTAAGGQWGNSITTDFKTDSFTSGGFTGVYLQAHGYGCNYANLYTVSRGSGNTLQVVVPAGLNANIKGINVYAYTKNILDLSTSVNNSTWVGYIDLIANPGGGTFRFSQAPLTSVSYPGGHINYGSANPTFSLKETTGGALIPGKTYYVAVLAHYWDNGNVAGAASCYRTRLGSVASITLSQTGTAIEIDNIVGDSPCYMVAMGEHPQLLQPQLITNVVSSVILNTIQDTSPNLVDLVPFDASNTDYSFFGGDSSYFDMLVSYSNSGVVTPIFCSRISDYNKIKFVSGTVVLAKPSVDFVFNDSLGLTTQTLPFGQSSKYCFAQLGEVAHFVNDYSGSLSLNVAGLSVHERNQSGYYVTDGRIAGSAIFDFGTSDVPKSSYVITFQDSIIIGGGSRGSESYNKIIISNALNGFNFSTNGTSSILAYVQVESGGEAISGLGLYSISTADSGVKSELLIGKRNSCYKLTALPSSYSTPSYMQQLSNQVGVANHFTIAQTDVGTLFAGLDNVYRMNENGEPTALGEDIQSFLKPDDPTVGVNPSYWSAVFHDGCYKLAYSVNAGTHPTQELWLNISKMKSNKNMPSWYGPHTGRTIDFSLVDQYYVAGDRARRLCVDKAAMRIYLADRDDYTTELGTPITTVLETKSHGGPKQLAEMALYMNKLFTRYYLKARVNGTITASHQVYVDEVLSETDTVTLAPNTAGTTYNDFVIQPVKVFNIFPTNRLRGRTVKTKLTITGTTFFSIAGIVFFFKPERRRI
jgi:hypothetical protein